MKAAELLAHAQRVLDEARVAVLATVDARGRPRTRWMSPLFLPACPGRLYALTSPRFAKAADLRDRPEVQWLIQNRVLTEVITLEGSARVLDNPALKADLLERLGGRLVVFWKLNARPADLVVLETVLRAGTRFLPMQGRRHTARLRVPAALGTGD